MNANQEFVDEVIVEFLTLLLYTVPPPKKIIWILVKTKPVTAHGADVRYIKIRHTVLVYSIASIHPSQAFLLRLFLRQCMDRNNLRLFLGQCIGTVMISVYWNYYYYESLIQLK